MGIISFTCQSKTIANVYFHLKNEGRDRGSSNAVFLLITSTLFLDKMSIYLVKWCIVSKQYDAVTSLG